MGFDASDDGAEVEAGPAGAAAEDGSEGVGQKSAATLGWTMREQKAASRSSWWVPEPELPS